MIYAELIFVGCWSAFYILHQLLFVFLIENFILFTFLYFAVSEFAIRMQWLHCPSLRNSRFLKLINQKLIQIEFTGERTLQTLIKLQYNNKYRNKRKIFAIEPHNIATLALACLFAAISSLNITKIKDSTSGKEYDVSNLFTNTAVVAHVFTKTIPFIRELLAIFNVIDHTKYSLRQQLKQQQPPKFNELPTNISLHPSGILGKIHASHIDPGIEKDPKKEKTFINIFRRKRIGFIYLALQYDCIIVPVLSLREQYAYRNIFWLPSFKSLFGYPIPFWIKVSFINF